MRYIEPTRDKEEYGIWARLANTAWKAREYATTLGNTKVGASVEADDGRIFSGCNVEHKFRSHDIHAEVNVIGSMVAGGSKKLQRLIIVAEREQFTPCGACMDWIFQLGGEECEIGFQGSRNGTIKIFKAKELMPFYPY
jgi:cytidine deaminase